MSSNSPQLFLSYSSHDSDLASELKDYLEQHISGLTVFMAERSIEHGEDWERRVHSTLKNSFAFVPIITPQWQKSRWCFGEWVAACVLGEFVFPFVEYKVKLRSELAKRQHLAFDGAQPRLAFERLAAAIDRLFRQHKSKRDFSKAPFPYAFQYGPEHAEEFRGCEREVDKIVCQINAMRHSYDHGALLVHGPSGSGKSSVVRAGVYPKLKISADWIVAPLFKTQSQPWESILQALSHSLLCAGIGEDKIAPAIREIDIRIRENKEISLDHVSVLLGKRALLFVVDNLDRYCLAQTSQTDWLFSLLRCAIRAPSINVLGVFRSDYLQQVRFALSVSDTSCNFMSIAIPDPKILISSLNQLLVDKGYDFDPNLIHSLFVDVGSQMEAWPLVGRCLYNLWDTAADKRLAFKLQNYRDSGGIRNQVEADLDIIESRLGRELEEFLEFLAFEGVSHVEGAIVVPRPIPSARIPQEYQNAIDLLVKNFLFVASGNPLTGEGVIEIIPNLIEKYWGNAQIARRALAMEELREAARAARQWKLRNCQTEWLVHRGNRLASAVRVAEAKKLTDSELRAYLTECERHFQ
jgi:hypothetical protein